jgi:hypothetical protein
VIPVLGTPSSGVLIGVDGIGMANAAFDQAASLMSEDDILKLEKELEGKIGISTAKGEYDIIDLVDGDDNAKEELLNDRFDITDIGDLGDLEELIGRDFNVTFGQDYSIHKIVDATTYDQVNATVNGALLVTANPVTMPTVPLVPLTPRDVGILLEEGVTGLNGHIDPRPPTLVPTLGPTDTPSVAPSVVPTVVPTGMPSFEPTLVPTAAPTSPPTCGQYCCTGQLVVAHVPGSEFRSCPDFAERVVIEDSEIEDCHKSCIEDMTCRFFGVDDKSRCLHATSCGGSAVMHYGDLPQNADNPGGIFQLFCAVKTSTMFERGGSVYDLTHAEYTKEKPVIPEEKMKHVKDVDYYGDYSGYYTCAGTAIYDEVVEFLTACYAKCEENYLMCNYFVFHESNYRCQLFPQCSKLVFAGGKETLIYMTQDEAWSKPEGTTKSLFERLPPVQIEGI